MNRLWAIGAVVVLGAGLALSPVQGAGSTPSGAPAGRTIQAGTATVSVAGKRVVLYVSAVRNFSLLAGDPQGRLQTSVYMSTADGSSLPGVGGVKIALTQGKSRWSPVLAKLANDVASERYYVAQGGPLWQVNSSAVARVEFKVGQNTYRADVPVKVQAAASIQPW
jgi:hypothetical protein